MKNVNRKKGYKYWYVYRTILDTEFTLNNKWASYMPLWEHLITCAPGTVTERMLCRNLGLKHHTINRYIRGYRSIGEAVGAQIHRTMNVGWYLTEGDAKLASYGLILNTPVLIRQLDSAGRVVFSVDAGRHQPETSNIGYPNGQSLNHHENHGCRA